MKAPKIKKTEYKLEVIDRKTGEVVQTETRMSSLAFDRLWYKAMDNINPLKYKLRESERSG